MKATLVFDGDCGFCTTAANFAAAKSRLDLQTVPWQRADLASLGLTVDQAKAKVQLHLDDQNFAGHECFAKLIELQGGWLNRLFGRALTVAPLSWLAALGYNLTARFRHRLPGGTPACKIEPK